MVDDTHLYQMLAGMKEPWCIERIVVVPEEQRVDVWAGHPNGVGWQCPECDYQGPCRDHAPERGWRHIDCGSYEFHLHARIPRVACPHHGVRQVLVPWAAPDSRFTRGFEHYAMRLLETCTVAGAAAILALSWDEARGIQLRATRREGQPAGAATRSRRLNAPIIQQAI